MYRVVIIVCCWMLLFTEAAPNQNTQANLDSPNAVEGETIIEQMSPIGTILFNALNKPIVCVNTTCIFNFQNNGNITTMVKQPQSSKSYHIFSDFKVYFLAAMHWCIRYGMRLATIESAQEQAIFMEAFRKHNRPDDDYYWIAGRRFAITGNFDWFPSGRRINYFNFDRGQPINGPAEFCLVVSSGGLSGLWHDTSCESNRYFVCES